MSSGTLVLAFTSLAIGSLIIDANSQEVPQAPQVQIESKSDSALESDKQGQSEKGDPQNTTIHKSQVGPLVGNEKSSGDTSKSGEEGHEFLPPIFGYKVKVTDAFLSIFTLGLFIATWFLYRATRDLVRSAEQTSQRQLRAYISVDPGGIVSWEPGGQPSGRITARNAGSTPAHKVKIAAKIQIVDAPPQSDIADTAPIIMSGDMAIMPSMHRNAHLIPEGILGTPEWDDVFNGKRWVIAFGYVEYCDVFKKIHRTRFCHLYQGQILSADFVRYHHLGNSAT